MLVADLHIHSRYSRATARDMGPEALWRHAQLKGVDLLGTGDFTHPAWWAELAEKLVETGDGAYQLRPDLAAALGESLPPSCRRPPRFLPSAEISSIYKRHGQTRKVHSLILMPTLQDAARLNQRLDKLGNIKSDGRPILGLDARDLLELCLEVCPEVIFIPAHIWTPWFSVFGSKSGFDALEEAFDDLTCHIKALETGLSSDPPMNWRLSALDGYTLVSNSDAHSPAKLAREANLLDCPATFHDLARALSLGAAGGFLGTIEFFPDEGKYHLDGHRKCGLCLGPDETRAYGGRCPVCGGPITVGVLSRVAELADRPEGYRPPAAAHFESLAPLDEVVAEVLGQGPATKAVGAAVDGLRRRLGPELTILRQTPLEELARAGGPVLAEAIDRLRAGKVVLQGGFDGQFGVVRLFSPAERQRLAGQKALLDLAPVTGRGRGRKAAARPVDSRQPAAPAAAPTAVDQGLDEFQRRAMDYDGGHLIVRAGPGAGKTRLLTARAARLVAGGGDASRLLLVTFTRKAAEELGQRLATLGLEAARTHTFHGLGLEILTDHLGRRPAIVADQRREEILSQAAKAVDLPPGQVDWAISRLKQRLDQRPEPTLAPAWLAYEQALAAEGLLDLDDLPRQAALALAQDGALAGRWSGKFDHILVDEYQDANPVQVALLRRLAAGGALVAAIGDPDQAIYGFRGAERALFADFGRDFAGARSFDLRRNYRSSGRIVAAATALMAAEAGREAYAPQAVNPAGPLVECFEAADPQAEAIWLAQRVVELLGGLDSRQVEAGAGARSQGFSAGDIAVLYRLHAQAEPIAQALARVGAPTQVAATAHLAELDPLDLRAQRVKLLSMHAAKGLEFPVVFVVGLEEGLLPYQPPGKDAADPDEERRLLYVAMTRARQRLFLSRCCWRMLFGESRRPGRSPFWADLPGELLVAHKSKARRRARQLVLF